MQIQSSPNSFIQETAKTYLCDIVQDTAAIAAKSKTYETPAAVTAPYKLFICGKT